MSTETMHYSADDEDGVVTVHKYDENGNEVFMREIDKASDMDTVIIKELDENGNVLKMASYLNGEQNYLYTQVFNDHGDMIERDDEDSAFSLVSPPFLLFQLPRYRNRHRSYCHQRTKSTRTIHSWF